MVSVAGVHGAGLRLAGLSDIDIVGDFVTEQNRKYMTKEIGKLLSDIW